MTAPDHFAKAELKILRRRGPSTYEFCIVAFRCLEKFHMNDGSGYVSASQKARVRLSFERGHDMIVHVRFVVSSAA
jgi:hypothetical protein